MISDISTRAAFLLMTVLTMQSLWAQSVIPVDELQVAAQERPDVEIIEITSFAAEPSPALKYRFWPAWHELTPGDAAPIYLRAVVFLLEGDDGRIFNERYAELPDDFYDEPFTTEKLATAKELLAAFDSRQIVEELRRAAIRETQSHYHRFEQLQGAELWEYLLPEVQEMRTLGRILDLEIRVAIAEKRFDEAALLLRDGFRLANSLRNERILISELVSVAISSMMHARASELARTDGAPNLYWALATLPRPLAPLQASISFEADFVERLFADPFPPSGKESTEAWRAYLFDRLRSIHPLTGIGTPDWKTEAAWSLALVGIHPQAKRKLIERGYAAAEVDQMAVAETVVRYLQNETRLRSDEMKKWTLLPMEMRERVVSELEKASQQEKLSARENAIFGVLWGLMPAIQAGYDASARLQTQIDGLMTIEAIRAHVAQHGELPDSLAALQPLPALPDPRSGEHFPWRVVIENGSPVGVLDIDFRPMHWNLFRYRFIVE